MESEFETKDGRVLRFRVNNETVDAGDAPPIDDQNLDEGATEATILVDSGPNTMTVEGAIAGIGIAARALAGKKPQRFQVVETEVEPHYRQKIALWKRVVFGLVLLGMLLGGSRALRLGL